MDRAKAKPAKPRHSQNLNHSSSNFSRTLREVWQKICGFLKLVWKKLGNLVRKIGYELKTLWHNFLRSFARWADPRLEPYRDKTRVRLDNDSKTWQSKTSDQNFSEDSSEQVVVEEKIYNPPAPATREELLTLLREAPMTVFTASERKAISAVLSLPDVKVSELMTPGAKIVFVDKDETLGPLVLDKLYRSGFTHFPVVQGNKQIIGTLQTDLLNSLDIKQTSTAQEVMDPRVYYIRADYTLEQALKAFLRTNSYLMIVVDRYEKLVGMLTFAQTMDFLFSEKFRDDFDRDNDRLAVAKRK